MYTQERYKTGYTQFSSKSCEYAFVRMWVYRVTLASRIPCLLTKATPESGLKDMICLQNLPEYLTEMAAALGHLNYRRLMCCFPPPSIAMHAKGEDAVITAFPSLTVRYALVLLAHRAAIVA